MITVKIFVSDNRPYNPIPLGRRGENEATQIIFDVSHLEKTYGEGTCVLMAKRNGDTTAYPVTVERDGDNIIWTVTNVDTSFAGSGKCELFWYVDNVLAKSVVYKTVVGKDIGEASEEPPDAYQSWVDTITEIGVEVQQSAQEAADAVSELKNAIATPEMYGAKGDGQTDDTTAIQAAFDSGHNVIKFTEGKTYKVSKNNNSTLYPDDDAPCLYLYDKHNVDIIGNHATLKVDSHGQGVLEVLSSSDINITGLQVEGYGLFPAISPDGRAEKGDADGGYYVEGYEWGAHKNASVDTSAYKGVNGDSTISWGTFGNGYIGNVGIGILIENGCENITVQDCTISGFNYSGVSVGFKGHPTNAYSKNILISDCRISNCYDNGVNLLLVDGATIENCFIENIGHPSARPVNESTPCQYTYADPGYGVTCRKPYTSASRAKNVKVFNNIIKKCARKGVDSHSVDGFTVKNNQISLCYVAGVEMAGGDAESTLSYNVIIDSNTIEYCGYKGFAINQYIYTGNPSFDPDDYDINVIISNNILRKCSCLYNGIIYVRVGKNTSVTNNIISGSWDIGTLSDSIIYAGNQDKTARNIRITGNTVNLESGYVPHIIRAQNLAESIISNNIGYAYDCDSVIYVHGDLSNGVDIIGNGLFAKTYANAPAYETTTGRLIGNTLTGALFNEIEDVVFDVEMTDANTTVFNNNTAIVNNHDGTYTVGTTDYGATQFGTKMTLAAGTYILFGVPSGYSYLSTTRDASGAFAQNATNTPKRVSISATTECYLGFRIAAKPASSFTIKPFIKRSGLASDVAYLLELA